MRYVTFRRDYYNVNCGRLDKHLNRMDDWTWLSLTSNYDDWFERLMRQGNANG